MSNLEMPPISPLASAKAQANQASREKNVAEGFETVFLTQFVEQMMETVDPNAFGGEKQAEIWRSFLSEAIAEKLTEQGGFGFGQSVEQAISSYQQGSKLSGGS